MAIEIKVKNGRVEIETLDIKGQACKTVIDKVVKAVNLQVKSEKPTEDFYAGTDTTTGTETTL